MSDKQKTAFLVAAAMAILHNGKRYEQNDVIELTEEEADKLAIYITPAETNGEQRAQAEQTASDELTAAEQVENDAEEAVAETAAEEPGEEAAAETSEEEPGEEAGETTKSSKGKNK
ncbi:hypothetical protein [Haemophilus parainfluenzae]|uniref:DUF7210 family protein n=1 Tax=Haemophilus parainfluenzae TaxID=729 RepID=UPI00195E6BC2|nr:hypothetical protein [Haemophilus parainfluenzae]VTX82172.1 Uncharacterised protein [Haemophilus parainfluenzae]